MTDEPIAQRLRGSNVVTVVDRNRLEDCWVASLHVLLVLDHRSGALFDAASPLKTCQPFEILQAVRLRSHHDGVLRHHEEVDEEAALDE